MVTPYDIPKPATLSEEERKKRLDDFREQNMLKYEEKKAQQKAKFDELEKERLKKETARKSRYINKKETTEDVEKEDNENNQLDQKVTESTIDTSEPNVYLGKAKTRLDEWVSHEKDGNIARRVGFGKPYRTLTIKQARYDNKEDTTRIKAYDLLVEKGDKNKFFDVVSDLFFEADYGWLALDNASCAFPLTFSLVDRSGKSYEAISLSDSRFDECLFVDYERYDSVNADFNRFGVYFINGLGLFKINIIGQKGCVLKYVAGANKKDGFNYNYTTTSIVPHRNIAVQELAALAFGNELMPEESF